MVPCVFGVPSSLEKKFIMLSLNSVTLLDVIACEAVTSFDGFWPLCIRFRTKRSNHLVHGCHLGIHFFSPYTCNLMKMMHCFLLIFVILIVQSIVMPLVFVS